MISIIITSHKEPKTIGKSIQSVLSQNIPNSEVIVVAPDKETLNAAKKYNVIHLQDPGQGKPTALNLAFKKARGNILVLTDGDVYLEKNSIKNLLPYFKDSKVGAVTGHPISINNRKTFLGYWSHLLNDSADLERIRRDKKGLFMFCSGYLFAMRNIIKKLPSDVLDDGYISSYIGKKYKIRYSPSSIVYIKNPKNFKDWILQKRRNSIGHNRIKDYIKNPPIMKSFKNELIYGTFKALTYPKTFKEFIYTLLLFPARLYIWLLSIYDKNSLMNIWKRIESTK